MAKPKREVLMDKKVDLIYVMDPHCGWCFGFGRVILDLFNSYGNNPSVRFDVVPGGLFYPAIKIPNGFADDKRPIASRIEELAGIEFSEAYFTDVLRTGKELNSEPPARAIISIKEINKDILIPFTELLLEKEFVGGKDNSLDETIYETVKEFDIEIQEFEKYFHSAEVKEKVQREFQEVQRTTTGFPVLFAKQNNRLTKLAGGFAPTERLIERIEELIA